MRVFDLRKLNSATKYPSIPTYHELGARGILQESGNPFKDHDGPVYVTEKIDGTNGRVICYEGAWIVGSREELLTASGDLIQNPAQGIVDALLPWTNLLCDTEGQLVVFYFEVYGSKKLPAWKTYGDGSVSGVRLFDVATISPQILTWDIERIASWRDGGGQDFESFPLGWYGVETVPRIVSHAGKDLPETVADMHIFLQMVASDTRASLDPKGKPQRPEGLVLRTEDRKIIAKARYEDYERVTKQRLR